MEPQTAAELDAIWRLRASALTAENQPPESSLHALTGLTERLATVARIVAHGDNLDRCALQAELFNLAGYAFNAACNLLEFVHQVEIRPETVPNSAWTHEYFHWLEHEDTGRKTIGGWTEDRYWQLPGEVSPDTAAEIYARGWRWLRVVEAP